MVVQLTTTSGKTKYGTDTSRERPNDSGSSSRNTMQLIERSVAKGGKCADALQPVCPPGSSRFKPNLGPIRTRPPTKPPAAWVTDARILARDLENDEEGTAIWTAQSGRE
jgi:hypothetical protein